MATRSRILSLSLTALLGLGIAACDAVDDGDTGEVDPADSIVEDTLAPDLPEDTLAPEEPADDSTETTVEG